MRLYMVALLALALAGVSTKMHAGEEKRINETDDVPARLERYAQAFHLAPLRAAKSTEFRIWYDAPEANLVLAYVLANETIRTCKTRAASLWQAEHHQLPRGKCTPPKKLRNPQELLEHLRSLRAYDKNYRACNGVFDGQLTYVEGIDSTGQFSLYYDNAHSCKTEMALAVAKAEDLLRHAEAQSP